MISKFDTKKIRSYFLKALIVSVIAAAVAGIITLLLGSLDEIGYKILITTATIGVYSIISLCCLTVSESRYTIWGAIGVVAASIALLLALFVIWLGDSNLEILPTIFQCLLVFVIIGVSIAHQSLLLRIIDRTASLARSLTWVTIAIISTVALMLVFPILLSNFNLGDSYWRILGVLAILDVLGTIVTPITNRVAAKN